MTHNERVLGLLSDHQPHSHLELYSLGVIAHSRVSDLRKRGYAIEQWREGDLYLYRLSEGDASSDVESSAQGLSVASVALAESVSPLALLLPEGEGDQLPFWMDNDRWSRKA